MLKITLLAAACLCLIAAFMWEIGKALSAPMRERWRKREDSRKGFPVVFHRPKS